MIVKDFLRGPTFLFVISMVLPGCFKSYKLVPSESSQGKELTDKREVVKKNLRTVRVYNQWSTEAIFDVLWLSEQARRAYVDLYSTRRGKSGVQRKDLLDKELNELQNKIVFYVLADVRAKQNKSLSETNPSWTFFLEAGGTKIPSSSIQEVELSPEAKALFGDRSRNPKFKIPYRVEFPASSVREDVLKKPFKMIISSVSRQCELGWNGGHPVKVKTIGKKRDEKGRLIKDEDYYWI